MGGVAPALADETQSAPPRVVPLPLPTNPRERERLAALTARLLLLEARAQGGVRPQDTGPVMTAMSKEDEKRSADFRADENVKAVMLKTINQMYPDRNFDQKTWDFIDRVDRRRWAEDAAEEAARRAAMSPGERVLDFVLEQFVWAVATEGLGMLAAPLRAGRAARSISGAEAAAFVERNTARVERSLVEGYERIYGQTLSRSERKQFLKQLRKHMAEVEKTMKASKLKYGPDGLRMSGQPPLRSIHPDSSLSKSSLDFWGRKSTPEIIDSLRPGQAEALRAYPDGRIANGRTWAKIT